MQEGQYLCNILARKIITDSRITRPQRIKLKGPGKTLRCGKAIAITDIRKGTN